MGTTENEMCDKNKLLIQPTGFEQKLKGRKAGLESQESGQGWPPGRSPLNTCKTSPQHPIVVAAPLHASYHWRWAHC